jgi:hypothetical protein
MHACLLNLIYQVSVWKCGKYYFLKCFFTWKCIKYCFLKILFLTSSIKTIKKHKNKLIKNWKNSNFFKNTIESQY